jgi:hypothetical protein
VVGSLVYRAASEVLDRRGSRPEVKEKAAAALARASPCLPTAGSPAERAPAVRHSKTLAELIPAPATRQPAHITKWAVGVTTAPRIRPTLDACLTSLTRAGWASPHLFMDSAVRVSESFGRLSGTLRSPAAGAWPNHYLSLVELTLREPDADAYLILQDDALLYDGENVREYLEGVLWPGGERPIVSLYCARPYTAKRYGWHRYRKSWVWGALALVFPRETAQIYLRDRLLCGHGWRSRRGGLSQIDVIAGWWAWRRGIPFWFPTPSLVQHIGETSTLSPDCRADGSRAASLFVGDMAVSGRVAGRAFLAE